jgi:hypothetical protein
VMRACNSNFSAWEICHRNSLQLTHMPRTTRTKPGVNMVAKVASHITVTIFSLLPFCFLSRPPQKPRTWYYSNTKGGPSQK